MPRRRWRGSNPRKKGTCKSQGGLTSYCPTEALWASSPQQGVLRLSGNPLDQSASGRARTRDRRVPEISGRTR
ncbi:hypothetical protein PoB_006085800 [Plakobranchus ocellatus]|uniref:Uncharacterized protein n=1 Tax=Plakobranchus ocellatus TaxID=259542 RepID=A0AAV4CR62_9GAST|nr:hypothetical protein PoB_006085800 [Plakobranchus ocellatus]